MSRQDPFVDKVRAKYPGRYSFEKTLYVNSKTKVVITCLLHGDFLVLPASFLNRGGCSACGSVRKSQKLRYSFEAFLGKAVEKHGSKYTYDAFGYVKASSLLKIKCPDHGAFYQVGSEHLSGKGCPLCGVVKVRGLKTKTYLAFLQEAKLVHNCRYTYGLNEEFTCRSDKVEVVCAKHGSFLQVAFNHLAGKGCSQCKADSVVKAHLLSYTEYVRRASERHKHRYTYLPAGYVNATSGPITIVCEEHGASTLTAGNHMTGANCLACSASCSAPEVQLRDLLGEYFTFSDRSLIKPLELDFLSKDKKIAIEFNGLYWHQENFKGRRYHLNKTEACAKVGVRLVHIREDLWLNRHRQVKDYLLGLTKPSTVIYGRKTACRPISKDECKTFLDKHHIQGSAPAPVCYGLFFEERLVSVCSFSNKRGYLFATKKEEYELVRFCSLPFTKVLGGLQKQLAAFVKDHKPESVKSFCDLNLFTGGVYKQAGFSMSKIAPPDYVYFKGLEVRSRYSMQKHLLSKKLDLFDEALTEKQNCENNKWFRYYGVGTATFVKCYR